MRYKSYKNKLIAIIRFVTQNYYNKLLSEQRGNICGTLKILHEIMGKSRLECKYPVQFNSNGSIIGDRPTMVNMFNKYFMDIGSELVKTLKLKLDCQFSITWENGRSVLCF